ncbi:MAG: amino acid permease, partial [Candidatus Babeliales bacterium]
MSTSNHQKIGLATATIVGMNAMIGAGIFSVPAIMASEVGPAGILTYIFVIIAVWFMAQSIARVAQLYPEAGSFYTYTKPWAGHTGGLIAAFSYITGLLIAMGLLAKFAGIFLAWYFPTLSPFTLGLCTLGALTLLNIVGVSLS